MASESFRGIPQRIVAGDETAENEVYARFAVRLAGLASQRLPNDIRARVDAEDVTQSVLRSFFTRQREQPFDLDSWEALWSLLAKITVRKCARQAERHRAERRDVRQELPAGDNNDAELPQLASRVPTPDEIAMFQELLTALLRSLPDEKKTWLLLRLEGHSVADISKQVGRTERSIYRMLDNVRREALNFELTDELH